MNRETATVNKQTRERERINYTDGLQAYFEHSRGRDFIFSATTKDGECFSNTRPELHIRHINKMPVIKIDNNYVH